MKGSLKFETTDDVSTSGLNQRHLLHGIGFEGKAR